MTEALQNIDRTETETDELDLGPLPGLIGYVLRRAQLSVFKDFIDTCAEVNIRPVIYSILTIIEHNPGARQGAVGAALGIKRSNVVSLINEIEQRGLAVRTPHETDRRSHALHLTAEGKRLLAHLDGLVRTHERRLIDAVGKDGRDRLIEMLDIIQNLPEPETKA